jgi:hypothetical protein
LVRGGGEHTKGDEMTTDEAIQHLSRHCYHFGDDKTAWKVVKAALAAETAARERAEAERDRLIEAWPEYGRQEDDGPSNFVPGCVEKIGDDWEDDDLKRYPTKAAAVRAAANLEALPATGEPATPTPATDNRAREGDE